MDDDVARERTDIPAGEGPELDLRLLGGASGTGCLFMPAGHATAEVVDDVDPPPEWYDAPVTDG